MAFLSAGALLGKLIGFVREIVFARLLGISFIADSYRGAVTAILLPISPLQGELVPAILIPLHREWNSDGHGSHLFTPLTALFGVLSALMALVIWLLAPAWTDFVVPGFSPQAHAAMVQLVQVMTLSMPASVMTACMSSIEISIGRARITTLRAAVQNVATIGGIIALAITGKIVCLALSFVAGFWLLLLAGGCLLWREGEIDFGDVRLDAALVAGRIFFLRARPLLAQPLAEQVNTLIERFAGSHLGVGAIASLDYSRTLTETAQYLVSQPIGYVVLAQETAPGNRAHARVEAIGRPLLALALPASLCMVVFAPDIVSLVYAHGAFGARGVALTSAALRGTSLGLWAGTFGYILMRMLNASARNVAVSRILLAGYAVNVAANLVLPRLLGTFGLGLGEAMRGLAVLAGGALMLGCGALVWRLVVATVPLMLLLAAAFTVIRVASLTPIMTLAAASSITGIVALIGIRKPLLAAIRKRQSRIRA